MTELIQDRRPLGKNLSVLTNITFDSVTIYDLIYDNWFSIKSWKLNLLMQSVVPFD